MSQKNDIIGPQKPASPQFTSVEGEHSEQKMPLVPLIRHMCQCTPLPYFTRVIGLLKFRKRKMARMIESEERLSQNVESGKEKLERTEQNLQILEKNSGGWGRFGYHRSEIIQNNSE